MLVKNVMLNVQPNITAIPAAPTARDNALASFLFLSCTATPFALAFFLRFNVLLAVFRGSAPGKVLELPDKGFGIFIPKLI